MTFKLGVAAIVALTLAPAAFSPAFAGSDRGAYSAVKTNFAGAAYSYALDPRFKRKQAKVIVN